MGVRNRVFPKYFVAFHRFSKKPGFFGWSVSKTILHLLLLPKKTQDSGNK